MAHSQGMQSTLRMCHVAWHPGLALTPTSPHWNHPLGENGGVDGHAILVWNIRDCGRKRRISSPLLPSDPGPLEGCFQELSRARKRPTPAEVGPVGTKWCQM
jgi:hypothetical protein